MKCKDCNNDYDPNSLNIPNPIPDGMCAICGNYLTQEEIDYLTLIAMQNDSNYR